MRRLMIILATVALLAGACGDDGGGGTASGANFCAGNVEINNELDGLDTIMASLFAGGDTAEAEQALNDVKATMERVAATAPGEIRNDVGILVSGFGTFLDVLKDADYNIFAVDENDPRMAALDSPEFDQASDRVNAFCGIDDDTEPDPSPLPPVDDGSGGGDGGDDPQPPASADVNTIAPILAQLWNIDEATAACVVTELGITSATGMDLSSFGDMNQEICGTTLLELFSGAG